MTRRRAAVATVLVAAAGVVVAIVLLTRGGTKAGKAASTSAATTTIRRRDLVETDSETGTLGYADSRTVVDRISGTVTWLPSPGSVIRPDHTLYKVDGGPVILLDGAVPAYRDLGPATSNGTDVRQLERNLRADGYDPSHAITVDGAWTAATTAAVERWQSAHGLPPTGTIGLGRIVFQPGSRRVAALSATLGSSLGSGGGGSTRGASLRSGDGRTEFVSLTQTTTTPAATTPTTTTPATTTPTTTTPTTTAPTTTTRKPRSKPKKKTRQPKRPAAPSTTTRSRSRSRGSSSSSAAAAPAAVSTPVMTTTSTRRIVAVDLDTTKSSIARTGARVTVQLPSEAFVHGTITSVGRVATSSSSSSSDSGNAGGGGNTGSSGSDATIRVTIKLFGSSGSLDQAPVTVRFEQSRVRDALSVPVTALIAQPGGGFAVEVVSGASRHLVRVTPGVYTSGLVQIEGAGLEPGMRVTTSSL
jgi:hypothetical protein